MGLHEYNVPNGSRRNPAVARLLLSDEDATRMGLTAKDRVSAEDQTVDGGRPEFRPATEADLAGVPVEEPERGGKKAAPRPQNKAVNPRSNKTGRAEAGGGE